MNYTGIENIPIGLRREKINKLSEFELWPLLSTILLKMGFIWAEITHGAEEHGKDLVGLSPTRTGGTELVAFIVKASPISGGVSGKTTLVNVMDQVKLAFAAKYSGARMRSPEKINRIVVVTNAAISNTASREISSLDIPYGSIEFWQLHDLEQKVTEYYPSFYLNVDPKTYEYLIALRGECEHVQDIQKKVHYTGQKRLSDIFVTVPVVEIKRGKLTVVSGKRKPKLDRSRVFADLEEPKMILEADLLKPKKNYVLVGGPGSGKSCLLRRTCIQLIEKRLAGDDTLPIPLFMNARELEAASELTADSDFLSRILCSKEYISAFGGSLEKDFSYTLFVDALDELPSDKTRAEIYDFLLGLAAKDSPLRLILASRPLHMWKQGPPGSIQEGAILPIRRAAMAELLEKLITKPQKSAAILQELTRSEVFHKLPRTPLVITLIALLHEEEELPELPANLAELYELFCTVYLDRWSKKGQKQFDTKTAILELLAVELHNARVTETSVSRLSKIAADYLLSKGVPADPDLFATDLVKENLLLYCKSPNKAHGGSESCALTAGEPSCAKDCRIGFVHLSFQEFFVARHLKRRSSEGEAFLADHFDDPWWGSIGMFFTGFVKDVPSLIGRVVGSKPPEGPLAIARMVNLGQLTQAATQTDLAIRVASCLHGCSLLKVGYDYGIQINEKHHVKMSRYQLIGALCWLYEQAYSSYHLMTSLRASFAEALTPFQGTRRLSAERDSLGLQLLGISWALANVGSLDEMIELSKHIDESDGVLTAWMTIVLESTEDSLKRRELPGSSLERRKDWLESIKRVKRRVRRFKKVLVEDMNREATRKIKE